MILVPMTDPNGAAILMLTLNVGYIDGIHGTPYIAAPWIRHGLYKLPSSKLTIRPCQSSGLEDEFPLKKCDFQGPTVY